MLNLITSFYVSKTNSLRNMDLERSLKNNIQSEYIERIHLFVDDDFALKRLESSEFLSDKIVIIGITQQPLYSDLVSYANTLPNKLCMISNSDIWLHSILNIDLLVNMSKSDIYALTRHESDMTSPLIDEYRGSHDVFIFHSPLCESIIKHIKFPQNVWGSENVLLYEFDKLKYNLSNPCRQIKIIHEHILDDRDENRERINRGDIDGDGIHRIRSHKVEPSMID